MDAVSAQEPIASEACEAAALDSDMSALIGFIGTSWDRMVRPI
jgi:hypothetical protein